MQKKIITCLATALFCLNTTGLVLAANWQGRPGGTFYDASSLQKAGNIVEVAEKNTKLVNSRGAQSAIVRTQYDTEGKKWRVVDTQLFNSKGIKLIEKKSHGKWQKYTNGSAQDINAKFYEDCARLQGNWVQAKVIGTQAVKFFDSSNVQKTGKDGIDVWEKLVLNTESKGIKTIVSHMQYNLKTKKVTTVYNCNFDKNGVLLSSATDNDVWGADNDPYGEYIGKELNEYLKQNKKK